MSTVLLVLQIAWRFALACFIGSFLYWLGVRYGLRHPLGAAPPRPAPAHCPWCRGTLDSVLVWSSVCRDCNRGQIGPFETKGASGIHLGWDPGESKPAPPFVSHVDVGAGPDAKGGSHEW
jgi:hypothetical protein